jgi:adenine deaminase
MARNLHPLLPVVQELGPWRCAFCTDDKDPDDIADAGHVNGMVREAVAFGIPPEDALLMASLHPAQWHGLHELGAIAPGYRADLLLLPDLESFQPELVLKAGRPVGAIRRPEIPQWVRESVNVRPPATADFRIPFGGEAARVIGLVPDQVVTEHLVEQPTVRAGEAVADPERDHAKIAVLERHHASGRIGLGLVKGFGLRAGALASTVGHDAHNLCVVGMDDADMVAAVERLAALGGGIVVVEAGEVRAELPLPIGGLLSDLPLDEVIARTRACADAAAALGCRLETPFLTMSFLPLSVIPSLKITDRGLVDVDAFELVPLEA